MEHDLLNGEDHMLNLIDIAPQFTFIANKNLLKSTEHYRQEEFGNAVLVMEGSPFSLRFERDRGQVFVDVGGDSAGWHKLEYVLEFADNTITQGQLGEPPSLVVMAHLLQLNWEKVANLFSDEQKTAQLRSFAGQKSNALLTRLFPKSTA
jgi:hypothetical protein